MKLRIWLLASIALALGGCDFAPRYAAPAVSLPPKFKDEPSGGAELSASETWWRTFNDRTLDNHEGQIDVANPDLAAAVAADEVAKARAEEALAGLLPQADAIGQITANRQSDNRPLRSKGQPDFYGNNILGGQVSYEIDLWGRAWIPERSATRLREADLNVLSKLGKQGLEWRLEPEAFAGREVGREDDLLDFLVGCPVDIEVARQPST